MLSIASIRIDFCQHKILSNFSFLSFIARLSFIPFSTFLLPLFCVQLIFLSYFYKSTFRKISIFFFHSLVDSLLSSYKTILYTNTFNQFFFHSLSVTSQTRFFSFVSACFTTDILALISFFTFNILTSLTHLTLDSSSTILFQSRCLL